MAYDLGFNAVRCIVTIRHGGDHACTFTGKGRMGAFTEPVVLPSDTIARRLGALSSESGCLPLPRRRALAAIDMGYVAKVTRTLVYGVAGGMSSFPVQLARQPVAEALWNTEIPVSSTIQRAE